MFIKAAAEYNDTFVQKSSNVLFVNTEQIERNLFSRHQQFRLDKFNFFLKFQLRIFSFEIITCF